MATVDHVAAVVKDLDASVRVLVEGFGFKSTAVSDHQELGIRVCFVEGKNTSIELIQPVAPGPYLVFLEKGLLGFNHIAIEVNDMASAVSKLKGMGIEPSGSKFLGAKGEIQNLDPSTTSDLRLQIIEPRR